MSPDCLDTRMCTCETHGSVWGASLTGLCAAWALAMMAGRTTEAWEYREVIETATDDGGLRIG